jgi:paraquat-inducible protein B
VFLVVQAAGGRGQLITVYAEEGHGVKAGDALRYRGIDVGVVERVELSSKLDRVELYLRLDPDAHSLARAGSRFWVVRPQLTLDSFQGLETVVGV